MALKPVHQTPQGRPLPLRCLEFLGAPQGAPEGFALRFVRNQLACKRNQTLVYKLYTSHKALGASGDPLRASGQGHLEFADSLTTIRYADGTTPDRNLTHTRKTDKWGNPWAETVVPDVS